MYLTEEAISFTKNNPSTLADIAYSLGRSMFTITHWLASGVTQKWPPAGVDIIARDMGKNIKDITTLKQEA